MKILHINCNYLDNALHQVMIEHLNQIGVENRVFVPTYDERIAVIEPNGNVTVSECFRKLDRVLFDFKQAKILKSLERSYDARNFDCIHAYTLFTDGNCAMKLSHKTGKPYVVAVRNTDVNDFFGKMIHLRSRGIQIMSEASAVFFLSEVYRKHVFERYVPVRYADALATKTFVIPNGIDDFWVRNKVESISTEHQERINRKELRLVYAGRINKNKNLRTTLEAIEILKAEGWNVRFEVVGRIEKRAEYKRILVSPYACYIPQQPKQQLIEIYRANDVFVMPSFTESFGLAYVEAMSQGLPVVYSQGQGFDGQFEEGAVGRHAQAGCARSVADAILKVIGDYAAIRDRVVDRASRYSWDRIVVKYTEIYATISRVREAGAVVQK
jgi:glycosyltransferase involved in cell wall biosynthesis